MDHDLARRALQIFEQAIDVEPRALETFLRGECGEEQRLRREVDALLTANADSASLLRTSDLRNDSTESRSKDRDAAFRFMAGDMLVGRYKVTAEIGRGGMGEVYRAFDQKLHRDVAIKTLRSSSSVSSAELEDRFRRELQSVAALSHPNIMTLHDVTTHEDAMLAVMEFVPGKTARVMIADGMEWPEVARLAAGVARGLAAAHQSNLMHRDIKPENIMVTPTGHAKLLDFGLARAETPGADQQLTMPQGMNPGTIPYMSPEQADGQPLSVATDVFSFGTVIYEMLTGANPFRRSTALQTMKRIEQTNPAAVNELVKEVPQALTDLVARMHSSDPAARPTAETVANQLDLMLQHTQPASGGDSTLVTNVPTNLIGRRLDLTGRERELKDLIGQLREHHLVSVVGPGGGGKTSLALAAAQSAVASFPGGVWVCEFAPLRQEEDLVGAVAGFLDGNAGANGAGLDTITNKLAGAPTLVVFDNCEHVIDAAAELVEQLAQRLPNLTLLMTSREPLDVPNEYVYRIEGLEFDGEDSAAVELFVRRATALAGYKDVPDQRNVVQQIVRQLEGLPLAIELAAPRLSAMSLSELLEALDDQMETLRSRRRSQTRQGTINQAIVWSYDLLEEKEQQMLLSLAVFAAPFTIDAALAVCGEDKGARRTLQRLVEQSVVVRRERKGYSRYRLLEPIRQFCISRIEDAQLEVAQRHHAEYYADRAVLLARGIDGEGELAAAEALNAEWSDLREAFSYGRAHRIVEIAVDPLVALSRTLLFHLRSEAYRWLIEAERVFGDAISKRADVNAVIATGYWVMGNPTLTEQYIERAEAIELTPLSLRAKYFLRFSQNRFEESADAAFDAEQLAQETGDTVEARWWANAFRVCPLTMANPNDPRVDAKLQSATKFVSGLDWPTGKAFLHMAKGTVAITRRDLPNAYRNMSKAIDIAVGCGNRWIESVSGLIANGVADPSLPPQDRLVSAIAHLKQLSEMGEEAHYPLAVRGIVTDLVDCGRFGVAAQCSGLVASLQGVGDEDQFNPRYPEAVQRLASELGPGRLEQFQREGAAFTIQQLIDLAEQDDTGCVR